MRRLLRIAAVFASTACVSMGAFQRAETLGPGHWQVGVDAAGEGGTTGQTMPEGGVAVRVGVSDSVDVSASGSTNGAELGAKIRLTKADSSVIVSLAPSLAGWPGWTRQPSCPEAGCATVPIGFAQAVLPVLVGIPFAGHELVLSARLIDWSLWNRVTPPMEPLVPFVHRTSVENSVYVGATAGIAIRVAPGFQIVPEFGLAAAVMEWNASTAGAPSIGGAIVPYDQPILIDFGIGFLIGS